MVFARRSCSNRYFGPLSQAMVRLYLVMLSPSLMSGLYFHFDRPTIKKILQNRAESFDLLDSRLSLWCRVWVPLYLSWRPYIGYWFSYVGSFVFVGTVRGVDHSCRFVHHQFVHHQLVDHSHIQEVSRERAHSPKSRNSSRTGRIPFLFPKSFPLSWGYMRAGTIPQSRRYSRTGRMFSISSPCPRCESPKDRFSLCVCLCLTVWLCKCGCGFTWIMVPVCAHAVTIPCGCLHMWSRVTGMCAHTCVYICVLCVCLSFLWVFRGNRWTFQLPRLQTFDDVLQQNICATKRAVEMGFPSGPWKREISRLAVGFPSHIFQPASFGVRCEIDTFASEGRIWRRSRSTRGPVKSVSIPHSCLF